MTKPKILLPLFILLTSVIIMTLLTYLSEDDGASLGSLMFLFNSFLIGGISLATLIYYGLIRYKEYSIHLAVGLSAVNLIIGLITFFS